MGDTVLSLVADGPSGSSTYHCVFRAELTAAPAPAPLGDRAVRSHRRRTDLLLLPGRRLRDHPAVRRPTAPGDTVSGESLTYTKSG